MKKRILKYSLLSFVLFSAASCTEDSLEPELSTERDLISSPVSSISDLEYLTNGMYKRMRVAAYYGRDYIIFNEARTDNAYSIGSSNRFVTLSEMRVNIGDAYPSDTWLATYRVILNANYIINATDVAGDVEVINDYKAQALVTRAMAHFDLMKLYGQQHITGQGGVNALTVPYVVEAPANSDVVMNMGVERLKLSEIRTKIYQDLDQAISNIQNTSIKTNITKQAALGIKSRVALYFASFFNEDYQVAYDAALEAIAEGGSVAPESNFFTQFSGNVIDANSVFELAMPSDDHIGNTGLFEIYNGNAYGDIVAQNDVAELFSNEDIRGAVVEFDEDENLRNVKKYTAYADNVIVMRYEELLLNAAEAATHIGASTQALTFINQIRENRGLDALTAVTVSDVLEERRKELIFEGFRFDDLMRLRQDVPTNPRMTETFEYGHYRIAFPIPLSEINASGMQQNSGY